MNALENDFEAFNNEHTQNIIQNSDQSGSNVSHGT